MPAPTTGERRFRIIFEKRPKVSDALTDDVGVAEGDFEEQFREWAAFLFIRGRPSSTEPVLAQRLTGIQPFVMTIPNSQRTRAIDGSWRAREINSDDIINIRSVSENREDRKLLDLLCETGPAA